jgi:hypothetical protein
MSDDFSYDVFLSHSSKDKAVVRPLAEKLRADGLRVWLDDWEIRPGDSVPAKIEEVLERSRVLELPCHTPPSNKSRLLKHVLRQGPSTAFRRARQEIIAARTYETYPANLQPRVSHFNRQLAEFLRAKPPAGIDRTWSNNCLNAIEAPCARRGENELRSAWADHASAAAKSLAIIQNVDRLGIEPFSAPTALPRITINQIHLICWMSIAQTSCPIFKRDSRREFPTILISRSKCFFQVGAEYGRNYEAP